ncbi:T-cell surface glycoprotein CD1b-3-like [Ctenodactylus gundi]
MTQRQKILHSLFDSEVLPAPISLLFKLRLTALLKVVGYDENPNRVGAGFADPFEVQVAAGCELHSETTVSFFQMAYQGFDFLSFQNDTWLPSSKGGYKAKHICRRLNHYPHLKEAVHKILRDTCPHFIQGLLEEGKAYFQRQVRPEAWLSSGPSPGPGRLQLVCHVSGFYPKSVQVMWMRGEQEHPGTQRGDVLPNADETWYLRAALDVADGDTAGLCCQVKHSSLGGQDIVLYWGHAMSPPPRRPPCSDDPAAQELYMSSTTMW